MSSTAGPEREAQSKGIPPGFEDAITHSNASGQQDLDTAVDSTQHRPTDLYPDTNHSIRTKVAHSDLQDVFAYAASSSTMATQADMPSVDSAVDVSSPAAVPNQEPSETDAQDSAAGRQGKLRKFRPGHATYAPPARLPNKNDVQVRPVVTVFSKNQLVYLIDPHSLARHICNFNTEHETL